jgi:peptide/nickel transport system permease protein
MSATEPEPEVSHRRLAWNRRREALASFWRHYRANRAGLVGLILLAAIILLALATPLLVPAEALRVTDAVGVPRQPPSWTYPLGTDADGRSVLDLMLWGARISLLVGLLATVISVGLGSIIGVVSGHFRGWTETLLMRVTDWFVVLPMLVIAIALAAVLSRSTTTMIIAIGAAAWPPTARVVRAQTLAVEARPYIERAKALGAGHLRIMTRHVLPNVMPVVLAQTTLMVATAIIAEATLAFLGLGDPNVVSWGRILEEARRAGAVSSGLWWYVIPPGLAIAVVALCFTLCGRALEGVLNPRLRRSR